jgi:hypothetical protein
LDLLHEHTRLPAQSDGLSEPIELGLNSDELGGGLTRPGIFAPL